jgi:signal peptidase II
MEKSTPSRRNAHWVIGIITFSVLGLDQLTKVLVDWQMPMGTEHVWVDGFFKLVHWRNDGAAWSLFSGQNKPLALIAAIALIVLFFSRHHFEIHTRQGQISLGLIFGGITGNLIDRLFRDHVIDFLRFYMVQRGGGEIGFPAFNVADSGICVGVVLLFIISWKAEPAKNPANTAA